MRRLLVLSAFVAISVSACGSNPTTPAAQTDTSTTSSVATSATAQASTALSPTSTSVPTKESTSSPSSPSPTTESTTEAPTAAAEPGVTITTADTDYGRVLFDGSGQAIYLFDRETTAVPDCYDDCAVAWPPVRTDGPAVPADGVMTDLLGTTPRTDGSIQVTYAGHPLYYYAHEGKNEVTCHDVTEYGGLWLAVAPTGEPAP